MRPAIEASARKSSEQGGGLPVTLHLVRALSGVAEDSEGVDDQVEAAGQASLKKSINVLLPMVAKVRFGTVAPAEKSRFDAFGAWRRRSSAKRAG